VVCSRASGRAARRAWGRRAAERPSAPPRFPAGARAHWGWATNKITVVDVQRSLEPEGRLGCTCPVLNRVASRRQFRSGSSSAIPCAGPEAIPLVAEYDPALFQDKDKLRRKPSVRWRTRTRQHRATPLQSWFPEGKRKLPDGTAIDRRLNCGTSTFSNAPERLGLVHHRDARSRHLDAGVSRASIVGGSVLYATKDHLYLASQHWWWCRWRASADWTYVPRLRHRRPVGSALFRSAASTGTSPTSSRWRAAKATCASPQHRQALRPRSATPGSFRLELGSRLSILAAQPARMGGAHLRSSARSPSLEAGERLMATRFLASAASRSNLPLRRSVGHARPH